MLPREIIAYGLMLLLFAGVISAVIYWNRVSPRQRFLRSNRGRQKIRFDAPERTDASRDKAGGTTDE